MTMETLISLLAFHFACSDASTTRQMSSAEIASCSDVYTEIKLAFVDGMDAATFRTLPIQEQAAVNSRAYRAYYDWSQSHPGLISHARRIARGEARPGTSL